MEGFVKIRLKPWCRRLITRLTVVVPAVIVVVVMGDSAVDTLLIVSQVILSFQLSFAVVPLVLFTNDKEKMGEEFVNRWWVKGLAWVIAIFIGAANAVLLYEVIANAVAGKSR